MLSMLKKIDINPHKKKKERLLEELKHYNELSEMAVKLGDADAYQALQVRIKDTYWEMMSASFLDAFIYLLPHVLIISLLSIKFRTIHILGLNIDVLLYYVLAIILFKVGKKVYVKFTVNNFREESKCILK